MNDQTAKSWAVLFARLVLGLIFFMGAVLAIVTFGHLLEHPLYAFHEHVIPRLALLLFVFLMPQEVDRFSLDRLLQRRA